MSYAIADLLTSWTIAAFMIAVLVAFWRVVR